jgi:hypothetical protein
MARRSLLIDGMYAAAEAAQPITGRGIGYKLFTAGLIPSVAKAEMQRVYRLLKEARERGYIRGSGSLTRPARLSGYRPGTIRLNMLEPAHGNAARLLTGLSKNRSRRSSKSGARRERRHDRPRAHDAGIDRAARAALQHVRQRPRRRARQRCGTR